MPTGFTTVSAAHLQDATGTAITDATISFLPVSNAGAPISFRTGGTEGQTISQAVSADVVAGAFSIQLADTSLTAPVNVGYRVTVTDNAGHVLLAKGYECIQPTGPDWSLDSFVPNYAAQLTIQTGPAGLNNYQLYQAAGGELSEADWLASLQAPLTADQAAALASLGVSVTQGTTSPSAGSSQFDPNTSLIDDTPSTTAGIIASMQVYSLAPTTATVQVVELNGDGTLTAVASSTSVALAAGLNTLTPGLPIAVGQYVGVYVAAGGSLPGASLSGASVWFTTGIVGTSTSKSVLSNLQLQFNYTVTTGLFKDSASMASQLAALPGLQAAVGTSTTIGPSTPNAGSGGYDPNLTLVAATPSIATGTVTSLEVYALAAGAASVEVVSLNGDGTLTLVGSASVVLSPGLNTVSPGLAITAGQYVGIYTEAGGIIPGASGVSGSAFWFASGPIGTNTAKTVFAGTQLQFNFTVQSGLFAVDASMAQSVTSTNAALAALRSTLIQASTQGVTPAAASGSSIPPAFSVFPATSCARSGTVSSISFYTATAGATKLLHARKNADGTFTLIDSLDYLAVVGLNTVTGFQPTVNIGDYLGIYAASFAIASTTDATTSTLYYGGLVGTNTPISTDPNVRLEFSFTLLTTSAAIADELMGNGILAAADPTGVADSTSAFASARGVHPYPYVPAGTYAVSSLPNYGEGFWGPGTVLVNGVKYPIPLRPQDAGLLLQNRAAVYAQISSGAPLVLIGDSLSAHFVVSALSKHWFNLYTRWINKDFSAGVVEPICCFLHTNDSGDTPAFYGLTLSGNTDSSAGPISTSTVLAVGGSISFTGQYDQVDCFFTRSSSAGSLQFAFNGTVYKTVSANGSAANDVFSGPSTTGQSASGTYTITAITNPVEITGVVRQNATPTKTNQKILQTMRAAHGGYSTASFGSAQIASILTQSAALSAGQGPPAVIIGLLTNDTAAGPSGVAAYQANLTSIFTQLVTAGVTNIRAISPPRPGPGVNASAVWDAYYAALESVCASFSKPIFHLDTYSFLERGLLSPDDQLHWPDPMNAMVFDMFARLAG